METYQLTELYARAGSVSALARLLGVTRYVAKSELAKHGITVNRKGYVSPKHVKHYGTEHHNWKGGTWRHSDGYIYEYAPNHPAASGGYVLQHRLVMEAHLGRYLTEDETIHHINGKKDDNRIANLQVVPHGAHMSYHKIEAPRAANGTFTAREGSTTIIGTAR